MHHSVYHQVISGKWLVVSLPLKSSELITNHYALTTAIDYKEIA